MTTPILDLDINQKIPIIRVDSDENVIYADLNGFGQEHDIKQNEPKLELPKPSFRKVATEDDYMKRNHTRRKVLRTNAKESYYHHEEPTAEELMARVEYDMDKEDSDWLDRFNETFGCENNFRISENDFEKIMDRLEKESYFENQRSGQSNIPVVDQDAVCAICNDGDCSDVNVILFCDLCDLAVHQECYGVPYIPEGQWLCRRCLQSPLRNVECVLCPNMGGAFKQTSDSRWAHVICALWIPEVCFANTVFLEPIDSIDQIPMARWRLNCYICKQKKRGACIQCHKPNCYAPFHVTCAQQAGLYMKIRTHKYESPDGGTYTDVKKEAFCDMHTPTDGSCGDGMYSGDETDEDYNSEAYQRKSQQRKKQIKKTRKLLAERREDCLSDATKIMVDSNKLEVISNSIGARGKRLSGSVQTNQIKLNAVKEIHKYWQDKRIKRSGVPLLRRLQVSYYNNNPRPSGRENLDTTMFTRLRYDLEKCRLLIGEVKKRELTKRKMFKLSKQIIDCRLSLIDKEEPPDEE